MTENGPTSQSTLTRLPPAVPSVLGLSSKVRHAVQPSHNFDLWMLSTCVCTYGTCPPDDLAGDICGAHFVNTRVAHMELSGWPEQEV